MSNVMQAGFILMGMGLAGVFLVLGLLWASIALLKTLLPVKEDRE